MSAREKPAVAVAFLTADPGYRKSFRPLLDLLLSRNWRPELIQLGREDGYKTITFRPEQVEDLKEKWEKQKLDTPGWDLKSRAPAGFSVMISKVPMDFEFVAIDIDRDYLRNPSQLREFLKMLEDFYEILHPAYGYGRVEETVRTHSHQLGRMRLDINLERALPDPYWANFLGPEYVEMFGVERVLSAPCYSVKRFPDGGALLLLSSSPLDYFDDPRGFKNDREKLRTHLGIKAFDTGDPKHRGEIPRFRYLEHKKKILVHNRSKIIAKQSDMLSTVHREEWESWVLNNQSIAHNFVEDMEARGLKLDFSERSLEVLDAYVHKLNTSKIVPSLDFLKRLAAYVAQVIIRNTGGTLSFRDSRGIPLLWFDGVQVSPLARAQKVILEDETFEHWYRFITHELVPALGLSDPNRK